MKRVKDEYFPAYSSATFRRMLSKLTVEHLSNMTLVWCKLKKTQPQLRNKQEYLDNKTTPRLLVESATRYFTAVYKRTHGLLDGMDAALPTKRQLIDTILHQYWRRGLNIYQIAMIDTQTMILSSNLETNKDQSHKWTRSEIINDLDDPVPIQQHYNSNNIQSQVKKMGIYLKEIHTNHIYVCQHPKYPAIIIRVQLFDTILKNVVNGNSSNNYKRPFFIVIFNSSTYLAHSHFSNSVSTTNVADNLSIISSFESAFSSADSRIHVNWKNLGGKRLVSSNLETIFLTSGISRFSNCEGGGFIRYALGDIDDSPLDFQPESIQGIIKEHQGISEEDEVEEIEDNELIERLKEKRIMKVANQRFQGNPNGKKASNSDINLYEMDDVTAKRVEKLKKLKIIKNSQQSNFSKNKFSSVIPVEYVNFDIISNSENKKQKDSKWDSRDLNFGISFTGNDIFAGLYELALIKSDSSSNDNDKDNHTAESLNSDVGGRILNPIKMPSWISGENGFHGGVIKDGVYQKHKALSERNSNDLNVYGSKYFNSFKSGGLI